MSKFGGNQIRSQCKKSWCFSKKYLTPRWVKWCRRHNLRGWRMVANNSSNRMSGDSTDSLRRHKTHPSHASIQATCSKIVTCTVKPSCRCFISLILSLAAKRLARATAAGPSALSKHHLTTSSMLHPVSHSQCLEESWRICHCYILLPDLPHMLRMLCFCIVCPYIPFFVSTYTFICLSTEHIHICKYLCVWVCEYMPWRGIVWHSKS